MASPRELLARRHETAEQVEDGAPPDGDRSPSHRQIVRRRAAGAAGAALVVVALAAAVVATSGGEAPPATGAARLIPADALAYVNVSTDSSRPSVSRAIALARRFPSYPVFSAAALTRLGAIISGGQATDFSRDIRPWLGKELAIAFLNTSTASAGSLIVLDVSDHTRAHASVARWGAVTVGTYRGTQLLRYASGTELAFVGHYLLSGQDASVRAAIDVASDGSPSLAHDRAYVSAASGEPDDRVIDAYVSAAGVRRVLEPRGGLLGGLGVLLDKPALEGVTVSLSPNSTGAQARIHSALDPALVKVGGSGPSAFSPTLDRLAPFGTALMLDTTGLQKAAPRLFDAGAAAGVGGQVGPLLHRLGGALAAEGVNVGSIVSIFGGESLVAIAPASAGSAGTARPPALVIIGRTGHEAQARAALATLEVPLAQLFPAPANGPGKAPEFNDVQVDGVTAHELSLMPGLQLDYAVFDGLVVVSTSRDGIAAVIARHRSVADEQQFRATLGARPARVASLLFLDLSQLLSLGEQTGLTHSAQFDALTPDLEKIRAVGMDSTSGEADTTAELTFEIP